jgi:hypothetical protein
MILCAHADAGFLNESRSRSRAGAHIYLSENDPFPCFNGPILSISQIIKFAMASAEAKLSALFIMARVMIPTAKPSSTWDGHNHAAQYKPTIQRRLELQTRPLSPKGPKWWT